MVFIVKLQKEVNQLIELNNKFPNVIQPDKLDYVFACWENIKADPASHENTSSLDIFKRELKGCIALLENQGVPQQSLDEGANIDNLQARLSRISKTVKKRPHTHPTQQEPVLPATQPTPLSEQNNSYAQHTALSEQGSNYIQEHPMHEEKILPATQPTRPTTQTAVPTKPVAHSFLREQPTQTQPTTQPKYVQHFQTNPTPQLNEKERDIILAKELKQRYELEMRAMVDQNNLDSKLLKEKSTLIKALELLIMNLKL